MKADVTLLAGVETPDRTPWVPFAPEVVDFLAAVSETIRASGERREEIAAFGFWCRRAHLKALQDRHASPLPRVGRGLLFHIAPSNVPTMFAYSLAIGLLAGNANQVRLSGRGGESGTRLCELLQTVLDRPEFQAIKARTSILSYARDDALTARYVAQCDGRVVWGGDETVAALRAMPLPPHGVELCFPDRWSLALLSRSHVAGLDGDGLAELAHRFYNDTYQMDQNACSSPQLVVWLEDGGTEETQQRWWEAVAREARVRYPFGDFQAIRKYERFCQAAMTLEDPPVERLQRFEDNLLLVARLGTLPREPLCCKGGFGLFFEAQTRALEELLGLLSPQVQTITTAGMDGTALAGWLARQGAAGVDRVVPVGQALAMDTIWDGKDLIGALSRTIAC